MRLFDWLSRRRAKSLHAFAKSNPDAMMDVVRADPVMYGTAMNNLVMEASNQSEARRSLRYPILNQLGYGGRRTTGTTLPKVTPFNLRKFSEYPPARRAINAICNPILDMPWMIEPVGSSGAKTAPEPTEQQLVDIAIAEECILNPNDDESFRTMTEQVLEDIVVGGYGAIEIARCENPLRPVYLFTVDGQSIRINVHWQGEQEIPRYTQSLGYVGMSVGTHDLVELLDEQLIYFRLNPRTNTPFGLGYLEIAFQTINAFVGAFEYAERRASNMTPNFGLHLGENMTPDQVRRWQQYWEQEIEGYGKIPILGGGRQPSVFHFGISGEDQLYLKWQEWLVRIIAMAFGLSPMKLGLERDVNQSTAEVQTSEDWDTVAPVANCYADYITRRLIWNCLGFRDLRFKWIVRDLDEKRQAEVLLDQWEMNSVTINEIREIYERSPLPDPLGNMTKALVDMWVQAAGTPQPGPGEPEPGGSPGSPPVETGGLSIIDDQSEVIELLTRAYALIQNGETADMISRPSVKLLDR